MAGHWRPSVGRIWSEIVPENARHRRAFDVYWRLGAERSVERLHGVLSAQGKTPSLRTLYDWSRRYRWQERLARLEEEAKRSEDDAHVQALREMYERQGKEALLLQQRGAEWLAGMTDEKVTADAAIRAVVEGARLERLARGEPTDRQEISTHDQENRRLAAITDAELDRLLEHAEGAVAGEEQEGP